MAASRQVRWRRQYCREKVDRTTGIRLTHYPSGGVLIKETQTTNPAWDIRPVRFEGEATPEEDR
jgi:hypothetical protein